MAAVDAGELEELGERMEARKNELQASAQNPDTNNRTPPDQLIQA